MRLEYHLLQWKRWKQEEIRCQLFLFFWVLIIWIHSLDKARLNKAVLFWPRLSICEKRFLFSIPIPILSENRVVLLDFFLPLITETVRQWKMVVCFGMSIHIYTQNSPFQGRLWDMSTPTCFHSGHHRTPTTVADRVPKGARIFYFA